jgi:hypothetical protein
MWYSPSHGLIKSPRAISKDGVDYPPQIFRKFSKAELANLGFHPARLSVADHRYYNTSGEEYTFDAATSEWVISYGSTPRDVDKIKESMKSKVNSIASSTLAQSDWMSVREHDGGTAMPADWKTYRAALRSESNTKESEIDALADLDAIKAYQAHPIVEVRYTSTYDAEGVETIGPGTESVNREVDKVTFGWSDAPDYSDPYHVRYE